MPAGAIDVDFVVEFVRLTELGALERKAKNKRSQEMVSQQSKDAVSVAPAQQLLVAS